MAKIEAVILSVGVTGRNGIFPLRRRLCHK